MQPIERRQNPLPCGPGWVYVLTCRDFPGCCKIDGTSRTPTHRALELQIEYRTASAFTVVAQHAAADWWKVEQTAHRMLSDRRLPRSELFRCSPAEASQVIVAAAQACALPYAPALWPRPMPVPSASAYPATRSAVRFQHDRPRGWPLRNPLWMMLVLLALIVLWLAVRQSGSLGVFVPMRFGALGGGERVRVIYP